MATHQFLTIKRSFISLAVCSFLSAIPLPSLGQTNTCGNAVAQLQQYVGQVNALANGEYYQGIPYRCQGNPNCMGWWLQQLNSWYWQQSNLVNNWYAQISRQCTTSARTGGVSVNRPSGNDPGGLDQSALEDLDVDDEDKTVAIRIPSNPKGFRR